MSLPTQNSDSDQEYDQHLIEQDEDDWQDAEEQHAVSEQPADPIPTQASKTTINEANLRKKIKEIHQDTTLTASEKARQIQHLMSHGTTRPVASDTKDKENADDGLAVSYNDKEANILGCKHYQRKCKLQANCCQKIVTCRFCHDDAEDHAIVRNETKNMYCMKCLSIQPAAQSCHGCKEEMARYYCDKCKLWDDDPKKSIYHCDDCGICRQGKGLGKDFFHCKKCNICLIKTMKDHKCIERNLESDCPICGEYMFTSTSTVIFMPCGHCIHKHCYTAYIQTSYQCPTCLKSLGDMSEYFNRLDKDLERQPMPAEYEKFISHIFCNDCEKKTPAKYHFFYHKCGHCGSFNTTVLKTENTEETQAAGGAVLPSSSSSSSAAPVITNIAVNEESNEALGNSDGEIVLPQDGSTAGNSNMPPVGSYLGIGYMTRNPPPPPSSGSSSSSRARHGTGSNDG